MSTSQPAFPLIIEPIWTSVILDRAYLLGQLKDEWQAE